MAISNVRTGMIHTLGESLAAQVTIPHPASLFIFFPQVVRSYASEIQSIMPEFGPVTVESLCGFWLDVFDRLDLTADIHEVMSANSVSSADLLKTAARDTVLSKENPIELNDKDIQWITEMSLKRFTANLQSELAEAISM